MSEVHQLSARRTRTPTLPAMGGAFPELTVSFVGHVVTVAPDRTDGLVFGRGAALDIDSNPFLHRRVGRFVAHAGCWWVENLGAWTTIRVIADGAAAVVPAGGRVALTSTDAAVCFVAGTCNYELRASIPWTPDFPPPLDLDAESTATYEPLSLPLTPEQRLLVVALAEPRLRRPEDRYRLPSNRALAARLGWSDPKFNRKLDHLCRRLDGLGVPGMRVQGRRANDRRLHLVEHMVSSGQVGAADLALLDDYPPG